MSKPFSVDDLYRYRSVKEIRCAPRRTQAACVVHSVDRDADAYRSAIWLVPLDEGEPWQATAGTGKDDTPRWSQDGRHLAFVSDRAGGTPQVFLLRLDGGEARQVTRLPGGVVTFSIAPDGKRLLVVGTVQVDSRKRGATGEPPQGEVPQVCWRVPYKLDGSGFILGQQSHLFVVDVASGDATQIAHGPIEVRSADWSPDGKRIVFTRTREGRQAHRTDVWIVDADGGNARALTDDIASVQSPKLSPDGRTIVFAGSRVEGDAQISLYRIDVASEAVDLLGTTDLEVVSGESLCWYDDSRRVAFLNARRGHQEVNAIDIVSGKAERLVTGKGRQVRAVSCVDGMLAFVSSRLTEPCEVYAANADGGDERRCTDFNAWWRERRQPAVDYRAFTVPDGDGGEEEIEGWLVTAKDAPSQPMPLLVDAHGGPHSYADTDYDRCVHWAVLWSRGWAILALNPVGSSSYGTKFAERLRGRWGELDLAQQNAALDTLQHEHRADERLAITGKSYGGYFASWAIGQTERFKAAVIAAPVANLESHFGTSDTGYYVSPYAMLGEPQIDRERYRQLSPVQHVGGAKTPTLLLQGREDERCPLGQAEEMFAAIMRSSETPCEMVLYPGASHHLQESGRPSFRVDFFGRLVEWVERWTTKSAKGPPGAGR